MDFVLARGSSLGLYARKNAIPTLTLNDVKDVLNGFRSSAASIYSSASVSKPQRDARSLVRYNCGEKPPMKNPISLFQRPLLLLFNLIFYSLL